MVKREEYSVDQVDEKMDAGEEFVPEEAAELAQQPARDLIRREPRPSGDSGSHALLIIMTFMLIAYASWWRKEKIEVGYCGVGGLGMRIRVFTVLVYGLIEDTDSQQDHGYAFAELLRPECEPCPPHAKCYPDMQLECVDDYIKKNNFGSLGGLWPIPPACVPDTQKERRVMIMSDAALAILRENGAEQRCKEKFLSGDMEIEGVSEADLRQVLYDRKAVSPL
jgi:hypothetical protein